MMMKKADSWLITERKAGMVKGAWFLVVSLVAVVLVPVCGWLLFD